MKIKLVNDITFLAHVVYTALVTIMGFNIITPMSSHTAAYYSIHIQTLTPYPGLCCTDFDETSCVLDISLHFELAKTGTHNGRLDEKF